LQVPSRNTNKPIGKTPALFIFVFQMVEKKKTSKPHKIGTTEKKKTVKKVVTKKKSALEILKEKAKVLEGKVKEVEKVDIKGQVTGEPSTDEDTLVPIEDYLKSSMHLGTRVITPHMRKYIYKRRADGLAVFNTNLLDKKIRDCADYLSKFSPEQIVVVCKREAGWEAVKKFANTLGIKVFTKKYPAGTLTNINLDDFFEKDLVLICDPWLDKNALNDANKIKMEVMSICDSNNYRFGINKFVIGNNKSAKSLGMIFYLLTKLYIEQRKLNIKAPEIEEFIDDWENLVPPK
jgi:small subunit ribosomal protein S2